MSPLAHAQFGSGIVYDPTQSGHAVVQIEHEEQSLANQAQQIENGQQIFTNTVKMAATAIQTYNTVQQQYNLYHQMMLAPQMLYSRFLSPMTDLRMLEQISNTYGNSAGWVNSANTGNGAAAAYQQASVPRTSNMIPGYGTVSIAGQQQIAAQGATVDLGDSVMTNNLAVLGTIRANQTSRQTDIANLEAATQNQDPSQQTVMAELQRMNQILLLATPHHAGCEPDQRQSRAATDRRAEAAAGHTEGRISGHGELHSTYQTHVAPAYQGGAQALTY